MAKGYEYRFYKANKEAVEKLLGSEVRIDEVVENYQKGLKIENLEKELVCNESLSEYGDFLLSYVEDLFEETPEDITDVALVLDYNIISNMLICGIEIELSEDHPNAEWFTKECKDMMKALFTLLTEVNHRTEIVLLQLQYN